MPVCQYCGVDSPGDARFCGVCGRPFTNGLDASTSRSGANMQPPPPPQVPQRSSVPSSPPMPLSGQSQQPIRQSYPGANAADTQMPTIRQSYPGMTMPDAQPPTIRQSYPGSGSTPPSGLSSSNQSPVFLPYAGNGSSGEFNTTPALERSAQYDSGHQKLQQKKRSSGLRLLTIAIILVIVLIGGVGSVLAFNYIHNKPSGSGPVAKASATTALSPTATPVPSPTPTAGASPTASVTASVTVTPTTGTTATPVATPQNGIAPQSPPLPLTIPCVNCSYPKLTLILSSITLDPSNAQATNWNLTITNNGTSACSSVNFYQLQLEDPSGTAYQGQGQGNDTWTMNSGQQIIKSPTFQIVPQSGVRYTLNVRISINNCNDNTSTVNTYQTETFTF